MVRTFARAMLGALVATLSACGGEEPAATPAASGTGGAAGVGGGSAGLGGAAIAGTGGAGPLTSKSCTGQFGAATLVFTEEPMISMNGLSVTADQLELFYTRGQRGTAEQALVVRKRASPSQPFGAFEVLPELAGACMAGQRVNSDVRDDGLTLYITCSNDVATGEDEGDSTLRLASRATRGEAFVLDAGTLGPVQASSSISADELTAYCDGRRFGQDPPEMFIRTEKTRSFIRREPVPGIDALLGSLDIASDDLVLFGAANRTSGVATSRAIFRATRPTRDADFGAIEELALGLPGTLGSASITPSCSLYLIMALVDQVAGTTTYSAHLAVEQ